MSPVEPFARERLHYAHVGLAQALNALGRHKDALAEWGRAASLDDGKNSYFELDRLRGLAMAGCLDDVNAAIEKMEREGALSDYNKACLIALLSGGCKADRPKSQSLASDAVRILNQWSPADGREVSMMELAQLKTDPDLNPIRDRADFADLFARVERNWHRARRREGSGPPTQRVEVSPPPRSAE